MPMYRPKNAGTMPEGMEMPIGEYQVPGVPVAPGPVAPGPAPMPVPPAPPALSPAPQQSESAQYRARAAAALDKLLGLQQPKSRPSKWDRVMGAIAGAGTGLTQGPLAGIQAGRQVAYGGVNRGLEDYKRAQELERMKMEGLMDLSGAAGQEESRAIQQKQADAAMETAAANKSYRDWQKQNTLDQQAKAEQAAGMKGMVQFTGNLADLPPELQRLAVQKPDGTVLFPDNPDVVKAIGGIKAEAKPTTGVHADMEILTDYFVKVKGMDPASANAAALTEMRTREQDEAKYKANMAAATQALISLRGVDANLGNAKLTEATLDQAANNAANTALAQAQGDAKKAIQILANTPGLDTNVAGKALALLNRQYQQSPSGEGDKAAAREAGTLRGVKEMLRPDLAGGSPSPGAPPPAPTAPPPPVIPSHVPNVPRVSAPRPPSAPATQGSPRPATREYWEDDGKGGLVRVPGPR